MTEPSMYRTGLSAKRWTGEVKTEFSCSVYVVTVMNAQRSHKRLQLRVVNEAELRDEVVVVFVAGVDVGLSSHTTDHVKVMDVHMYKHPKQPAQYLLAHLLKVLWKRDS